MKDSPMLLLRKPYCPFCCSLPAGCWACETHRKNILTRSTQNLRRYLRRLTDEFGWQLLIMLASANFLRGSVSRILDSGQLPYYKNLLHITGTTYQSLFIVSNIPWSMKSVIGSLSDVLPIYGYHKRSYIIIYSVIGTTGLILVGLLPLVRSQAPVAAFLFFCANFQLASTDLLCQGKYAELMVRNPETSSDVVTFAWMMSNLGSFCGSVVAGPVADHLNPRFVFLFCIPIAFQVILPAAYGYLPEEKQNSHKRLRIDKLQTHPRIFLLGVFTLIAALCLSVSALLGARRVQFLVSVFSISILVGAARFCLPKLLFRAATYLLLSSALYISLPGALDYFYTANAACVPNGPNFDFTYYITYTSMAGSLAGAAGVVAFQNFLSGGSFRRAFLWGIFVKLIASLFDFILVKRINLLWHVPDKLAFMLGHGIIFEVTVMLNLMPTVVLTSKTCPPGMESTVYALLAGFQNFGAALSRSFGVALIDYLGIKTKFPCNFDNLGQAIIVGHFLLPLLAVPLVIILIPKSRMTSNLIDTADLEKSTVLTRDISDARTLLK